MASPQGIGALLTDDTGIVVAHAFDFERSGYGGFKLWEAQRLRAKSGVIAKYIAAYCYGPVASAMREHMREEVVRELIRAKKLTLTFVAIGHDVAPSELNR